MRLNQIRHFLAAVDGGSLRAAARRLGVTQPAMTKSLRQLEDEIGARVLLRTARGVVLTTAGRALLARARVIDSELRRIHDDIGALRGPGAGSVAIGVAPPLSLMAPDAVAWFRAKYPDARIRILEGVGAALVPLVRDEVLDFTIGQRPAGPATPGVTYKPLLRPQLSVGGRKGHPLAAARSLRDLRDADWLVFNPLGSGGMLERAFAAAKLPPPRAIVLCESYATALALIARTDLLGLLFDPLFTEPLAGRFLHRFDLADAIPAPSVGMFVRADTPLTPAAAAMAQAFTAAVKLAAGRFS